MKKFLLITLGLSFLASCSKYKFENVEAQTSSSLSLPVDNQSTEATDPAAPAAPPAPEESWLSASCNSETLRQHPLELDYIPLQNSVSLQQVAQKEINIEKAGEVKLQQIIAGKIHVEALSLLQFQQIAAGEIYIHARSVQTSIQQILAGLHGPKLVVEAGSVTSVQQVSALCLRTASAESIQQALYAKIIGEGPTAHNGSIQQLFKLRVQDASVDNIQQVDTVLLTNAHVKKVQQVRKLILKNSTVDEIDKVGEVINQ